MTPTQLQLQPWLPSDLHALMSFSATDSDWPLLHRARETLQQFVDGQQTAEVIGEGLLRTIRVDGELAGFVLLNTVPEAYLDGEGIVVECGTYLAPAYRGTGLNKFVKQATVRLAASQFQAAWCVFAVPDTNLRAKGALRKLNWGWTVVTPSTTGPFKKFVKRKAWETGQDVVLYAVCTSALNTRDSR